MALKHATETSPSIWQYLSGITCKNRRVGGPGVKVVEKPTGDRRWNSLQCRSWW